MEKERLIPLQEQSSGKKTEAVLKEIIPGINLPDAKENIFVNFILKTKKKNE